MMNAESVKAKLKNFARETGHTFQESLIYYGLERTIYRISVSEYAEHFVLKGGIFLYTIFDRNYERATTDVDFLAQRISNSSEEMKTIFHNLESGCRTLGIITINSFFCISYFHFFLLQASVRIIIQKNNSLKRESFKVPLRLPGIMKIKES